MAPRQHPLHYDEKEQRPDDRLSLDPRVEDLRMTAISILKRWELEYASNKYAPGFLNEFSSTHYYVQCGEETPPQRACVPQHRIRPHHAPEHPQRRASRKPRSPR